MRLTLLLTPLDGGTAWRQLLAPGEARAGWEQVGPLGLLQRLGRLLGYPAAPAPAPDRIAAYRERLRAHAGTEGTTSYSASLAADPAGVAAHLLGLRDRLRMAGWSGAPFDGPGLSERLHDLAALEALRAPPLPPGLPDLLETLTAAVAEAGQLPVELEVELAAPRPAWPPRLHALLAALARAGAVVREAPEAGALAPARTDLGRLQRALLDPAARRAALQGDGTFLLLEADTPMEAGELAAALLRGWPLDATTAVVSAGPEPLDAALARQGLPTLGLGTATPFRPHAQFLPLRLALAFAPRDPFRAAELLSLPGAPLPGPVRGALLAALARTPGIDSPAWRAAVEEAAAEAEAGEPGAGAALRERVEAWFGGEPCDPGQGLAPARAAALCQMVAAWAGSRRGGADEAGDPLEAGLWAEAAATALTLQRTLLALPPGDRLGPLALGQLHDVAAGAGSEAAPFPAEAGRPAVCSSPGAVLPGAAAVLWFGFVDGAASGPAPEPWTEAERALLVRAGLQLAAPGAARAVEAWGWRRPLLLAAERAALVRWRLDGAERLGPHPLQDELATRTAPGALLACTRSAERLLAAGAPSPPAISTEEVPPAAPIAPRAVWRVPPATLVPGGALSPTVLETLLGCPFRWALEKQAGLYPGRALDLPDGGRLLGDFAHRLLQDLLLQGLGQGALDLDRATPEEATARVRAAFDARLAAEAAPLALPGREVERDLSRTLVGRAAGELVRQLQASGWRPEAAEAEVKGSFAGQPLHGYVDLVLRRGAARALLDLKLGGGKYRRADLEEGLALQIALYSAMMRGGGDHPPAGFFILDDAELLTADPGAFPEGTLVRGPGSHRTVEAAERRYRAWREVFAKGALPLCAEDLPWEGPVAEAGGPEADEAGVALRRGACRFCHFDTLCRARVGEEAAP